MNEQEQKDHDEAVARAREANSTRNTERLKQLEAIASTSESDRELPPDDTEAREAAAAAEDETAREYAKTLQAEGAAEPEAAATPDPDTKEVNGETYYRQMVNGREVWQTLKQIRQSAQKVESADEYLRTAAESVRNASRLALSKDEPSSIAKVDVRSILRAAVLGDEEAIEKLASVIDQRPSEVTPDVVRQIDQRLSFRTELATLESKSQDLLENPYMGRLFRDRLNELKAQDPTMALSEAYTSIDAELRGAFPGFGPKTSSKLERKRTLVNVPTAASRAPVPEDEEGEEDVGQVIEKMAKARGLSPHVTARR